MASSDSLRFHYQISFLYNSSSNGEARRSCAAAKTGAEEGTRTPTGETPTAPSKLRVYQFHHFGIQNQRREKNVP